MASHQFVICIDNSEYPASLEFRKIYEAVPDAEAATHGQLRVIDESGEDYLYPAANFIPIELPKSAERAITRARLTTARRYP